MLFRRQVVGGGSQTPRRLGMSLASGRKEIVACCDSWA